MARKYNEFEKQSNCFRDEMEKYCRRHDGDVSGFFSDGSIYGETESGEWIVGFGVIGNANILIGKDCVRCGGYSSREFSPMLKKALADYRSALENC